MRGFQYWFWTVLTIFGLGGNLHLYVTDGQHWWNVYLAAFCFYALIHNIVHEDEKRES